MSEFDEKAKRNRQEWGEMMEGKRWHERWDQQRLIAQWPFLWLPKTGVYVAVSDIVTAREPKPGWTGDIPWEWQSAYIVTRTGPPYILVHDDDWPLIQAALSPPQFHYVEAKP